MRDAPTKKLSKQAQGSNGELSDFKCEMPPIGSCVTTSGPQLVLEDSTAFGQ